jgi:hypothetical protein
MEYLTKMFEIYENVYGFESEKTAKICMEIGQIYELSENISDAIDNYKSSFSIWEKIIIDNNYDVLFTLAIKISELQEKVENYIGAYEVLKSV